MNSRIKKSNMQFDQVLKIEQEYANLANVPFKLIERFEKKQLPGYDFNFSGVLIVNEFNLDKSQPPRRPTKPQAPPKPEPIRETLHPVRSSSSLLLAPPSAPLPPVGFNSSHSASSNNLDMVENSSLSNWILASHVKPQSESTISNQPTFMNTFENLLFCMDNSSFLSIYERAFTAELKQKNSVKLGVPNPRGIAANDSYFAVSYSGLKKEQMKGIYDSIF